MKTTIRLFIMLAVIAALVSCDAFDVDFDTTLNADLDIEVDDQVKKSGEEGYDFYKEKLLDPTSDPEVSKHVDKIKKYNVNSMTVKVTKVSMEGVVLMPGSWFGISLGDEQTSWTLKDDFVVAVGETYTLGNDNGEWAIVQSILDNNAPFTVAAGGKSNINNIFLTLTVEINATVTAGLF